MLWDSHLKENMKSEFRMSE